MIELRIHPEGVVLPVRVQPGASGDKVAGEHAGRLRIRTSAPPERGKANEAVLRILGCLLGRKPRQLEIVAGATSRDKDVLVRGAEIGDLQNLIERAKDGERR